MKYPAIPPIKPVIITSSITGNTTIISFEPIALERPNSALLSITPAVIRFEIARDEPIELNIVIIGFIEQ